MCGIVGFINFKGVSSDPIIEMSKLIRHRGPDDVGYLLINKDTGNFTQLGGDDTPKEVFEYNTDYKPTNSIKGTESSIVSHALAHRRLSILDLSPLGHQPLSYLNNQFWIIFNGEVYNYIEIRNELKELGYNFLSNSDTEVILAAYVHWGRDCVHKFNGMWAFVIYDKEKKTSFISRDRFGVKPLYYWISPNNTFCFSSEIKSFTAYPGWKSKINHQMTYDFIVWGQMDHTDETLFEGVYQLKPGSSIIIDNNTILNNNKRVVSEKWYNIKISKYLGSFEEASIDFKNIFESSLKLRVRSDVPIGSCLSGGLDSSSIVCLTNSILRSKDKNHSQKTFSACSDYELINEKKWIDEVVKNTNVDAHIVYPSVNDLIKNLRSIIWHQDEPFGTTSIFAQWKVFELASNNNVKVMLDGQGADEQLAGYMAYFNILNASYFKKLRFIKLFKSFYYIKRNHGINYISLCSEMIKKLTPEYFKNSLRKLFAKTDSKPSWYNNNISINHKNPIVEDTNNLSGILAMSLNQLTSSNLQMLLHWEDRDSMAFSIESRVPFLDYRLVEFALSLPDEYKINNGVTKLILRESMNGILPDKIKNRQNKIGFATPEELWIKELGKNEFRNKFIRSIELSNGLFDKPIIKELDDIIDGKKPFSFLPWRIICFGEWVDIFKVSI